MPDESARYERRDFNPRIIGYSALGLVIVCIATSVVIFLFERGLDRFFGYQGKATWTSSPEMEVPGPQLQANPARELGEMRAQEDALLHSYGWVDREHGVIRVPIEKAMQLTLERGLPTRKSIVKTAP
ncbi:MAG TPA: hypothetical protein VK961_11755 [Chthoniobacter sp.]|nr:hypothetical protein [Chthoniobacter sp.]